MNSHTYEIQKDFIPTDESELFFQILKKNFEYDIWDYIKRNILFHEPLPHDDILTTLHQVFSVSPPIKTQMNYPFLEMFHFSQSFGCNRKEIEFINLFQTIRKKITSDELLRLSDGQYYVPLNKYLMCNIITRHNHDSLNDDIALFYPSLKQLNQNIKPHPIQYYSDERLIFPAGIYIIKDRIIFEFHFSKTQFPIN